MDKFLPSDKHIFTEIQLAATDLQVIYTTMLANNKSIFIFGGDNGGAFSPSSSEVRRYDILDEKWFSLTGMPHYLWGSTAQIVDDEIFVMGGGRQSTYTSHNLAYNTKNNSWSNKQGMPISRKGLVSGIIDGIIYIAYGYQMWGAYDVTSYCYAYNPKTDIWTQRSSPKLYKSYAMSVVIDNFLYVLGGYSPDNKKGDSIKMERYSPEADSWESMPDMPRPRIGSVAVALDSKIFILCGHSSGSYITMDYYDTRTRTWTVSDIPTPQIISPGVAVINNKIYLTVGKDALGKFNKNFYEITYSGIRE